MWEGTVVSIHIAPAASAAMQSLAEVRAVPGRGLEGDRYFAGLGTFSASPSVGGRDITLIEIESVEALGMDLSAASFSGFVETPVERIVKRPGSIVPLAVMPLNGSASPGPSAASERRSSSSGGRLGGAFGVCEASGD